MENKKRVPIVAALLSIITPGLGQVYNGQLIKGILFYFIALLILFLMALTGLQYHFYGMLALFGFAVASYLFIAGEALFAAIKKKEMILKSYNKWYFYLLFVILAFGINIITEDILKIDPFGRTKAYNIPSGAMMPTLLIGDHILVDKRIYKKKDPQRGDIIILKYPKEPERMFIKRIVAIGGEKIEIKNKKVYINDNYLEEPYIIHRDTMIKQPPRDNFGPFIIPENSYFVMGDNRDQSYDSRFWGVVKTKDVIGKALYIYWAKDKTRIGMTLSSKL